MSQLQLALGLNWPIFQVMRFLLAITSVLLLSSSGLGQSLREARQFPQVPRPVERPMPAPAAGTPLKVEESLQQYLGKLVLEELPREYENKKKWGGTKRVMSG